MKYYYNHIIYIIEENKINDKTPDTRVNYKPQHAIIK